MGTTYYSYNTGHYFGTGVRVFGWITSFLAVMMIVNGSVAAYVILPAALITQFAHYRTEFDLAHMTYREGVRWAGLTFGAMQPLPGFDFLYLKCNRYSQTIESRASMSKLKFEKYDGYLKLADGIKLHLLQRKTKEQALREMQQIARDLNVDLRDLTEMTYRKP